MKKSKIFIFLIAIMLLVSTYVYAADYSVIPTISMEGETTAKPGETKTLTVKIVCEDLVGVVSGKIEKNENISSMTVKGKNNWNLTYNSETGVFNIIKAEGEKTAEIMTIEYTVGNEEGTGKITINDVQFTTTDYNEVDVSSASKQISIKNEEQEGENPTTATLTGIKITKVPTKTEYKVGEKFDKTGMVVTAEYSDGTTKEVTDYTYSPEGKLSELNTKITVTYKEGDVTKTAEQAIKVTSGTTNGTDQEKTEGDLPYTGVENYYIVIAMIAIIGVVSLVSYKKIKIK